MSGAPLFMDASFGVNCAKSTPCETNRGFFRRGGWSINMYPAICPKKSQLDQLIAILAPIPHSAANGKLCAQYRDKINYIESLKKA